MKRYFHFPCQNFQRMFPELKVLTKKYFEFNNFSKKKIMKKLGLDFERRYGKYFNGTRDKSRLPGPRST